MTEITSENGTPLAEQKPPDYLHEKITIMKYFEDKKTFLSVNIIGEGGKKTFLVPSEEVNLMLSEFIFIPAFCSVEYRITMREGRDKKNRPIGIPNLEAQFVELKRYYNRSFIHNYYEILADTEQYTSMMTMVQDVFEDLKKREKEAATGIILPPEKKIVLATS